MKRIIYIATVNINIDNPDGVAKKVLNQVRTLRENYEVDLVYFHDKSVYMFMHNNEIKELKRYKQNAHKYKVYNALEDIDFSKYQGSYIRYPKSDFILLRLLKKMKVFKLLILLEIPTYPYDMEGTETIKSNIIRILDRVYRKKLKHFVDRIITYSSHTDIFGVRTIRTINGIDFSKEKIIEYSGEKDQVNLIAVSGMYRVHGYDRIIKGLHQYYLSGGLISVNLHLVGDGDYRRNYTQLTKKYGLEENVVFHGMKFRGELHDLYCKSDIAINSLAIHRQGLLTESTLKSKEYVAKGLPMISSYSIDALSLDGNKRYVHLVPANDEPVSIADLLKFHTDIYKNGHEIIQRQIRESAIKISDMHVTFEPIVEFLKQSI